MSKDPIDELNVNPTSIDLNRGYLGSVGHMSDPMFRNTRCTGHYLGSSGRCLRRRTERYRRKEMKKLRRTH